MSAKGEQAHCRFCGKPFTASRRDHRFCRSECRLTFYKLGGVSEERLQSLILPVVRDFFKELFKEELFLRELRSALDGLPGDEKETSVIQGSSLENGNRGGDTP